MHSILNFRIIYQFLQKAFWTSWNWPYIYKKIFMLASLYTSYNAADWISSKKSTFWKDIKITCIYSKCLPHCFSVIYRKVLSSLVLKCSINWVLSDVYFSVTWWPKLLQSLKLYMMHSVWFDMSLYLWLAVHLFPWCFICLLYT